VGVTRQRNATATREVKLRTTPRTYQLLEALAASELYGKNPSEVAEELVRQGIRRIYGDEAIAGAPPFKG
jgi:hypothetical protein